MTISIASHDHDDPQARIKKELPFENGAGHMILQSDPKLPEVKITRRIIGRETEFSGLYIKFESFFTFVSNFSPNKPILGILKYVDNFFPHLK